MKVLVGNKFYYRRKGSETYVRELVDILEANQHDVIPFAMKDDRNWESEYTDTFISKVDYDDIGSLGFSQKASIFARSIYSLEAKGKISQIIKRYSPDIAHLNCIHNQISPSILPELSRNEIPVVYTLHEYNILCPNYRLYTGGMICERCKGHGYYNCLTHKCIKASFQASLLGSIAHYFHHALGFFNKHVDLFISPSEFVKEKFVSWGYDADKIVVINNPFDSSGIIASVGGDYALYLGGLFQEKGIKDMIEAFSKTEIKLKIAGDGDMAAYVRKAVKQYDNIEYLGFVKDPSEIIRDCAYTVCPSKWYENHPYSILESFAYGKPVISSDVGGLPEMVVDEVNGLVYPAGDIDGLRGCIERLQDKNLLKDLSEIARADVIKKNDPSTYYERLLNIYDMVL